jgi:hypothetical protein
MLSCESKGNGFATYQCLGCGKGEHKVNFTCKAKGMELVRLFHRDRVVFFDFLGPLG